MSGFLRRKPDISHFYGRKIVLNFNLMEPLTGGSDDDFKGVGVSIDDPAAGGESE